MLKKFLKILFVPIFLTSLNVSLCPAIAVNYGFQDDSQSKAIKIRTINISSLGRVGISNAIDELHKEFGSDKDIEKNTAKGILGEIVAIALYEKNGYNIIENKAHRFIGCEITSKHGKAGIDGIFIDNAPPIFNEAKYRANAL